MSKTLQFSEEMITHTKSTINIISINMLHSNFSPNFSKRSSEIDKGNHRCTRIRPIHSPTKTWKTGLGPPCRDWSPISTSSFVPETHISHCLNTNKGIQVCIDIGNIPTHNREIAVNSWVQGGMMVVNVVDEELVKQLPWPKGYSGTLYIWCKNGELQYSYAFVDMDSCYNIISNEMHAALGDLMILTPKILGSARTGP